LCVQTHIHQVKLKQLSKEIVMKTVLQISESAINESFESTNNIFDQFRLFTSSLFSQIMDEITMLLQNLVK